MPGKFVRLSQGITHFQWFGPVRGPVLVAIHGLATPAVMWTELAAGMGQLGYRVLVYDLYGRGGSDAPGGVQDRAFFLRQLTDLLDNQGLHEDITLMGYSMGGAIATAFAAENPHRVAKLILLATAGVHMNESRFSRFCRTIPVIGDWVHGAFAGERQCAAIKMAMKSSNQSGMHTAQLVELTRRGFLRSVLQSRRGMLTDVQQDEHRKLGREAIPVVAIWGDTDAVIPLSALGQLAQWNRNARQDVVKGADHALPHSHAREVTDILRQLLREKLV